MNITHINDPAEVNTRYGDAREPGNGLPWQSSKLGATVFVTDQSGCVFLIVRHDLAQPPSRLVRAFFRDAPDATVAVIECSGVAERTALLAPIQSTIAASLEADEEHRFSRPASVIDLDAPVERVEHQPDPLGFHAVRTFFLFSAQEFQEQFVTPRLVRDGGIRRGDMSTIVFVASNDAIHSAGLLRSSIEGSLHYPIVRQIFRNAPDAYGWVVAFDDRLLRDTFAVGLQQKVSELPPGGDDPEDGFQWPVYDWPDGGGDAGVPVATIRPRPTRSGSAAKELLEKDEPKLFYIGPAKLAETQTEGELAPARVTHDA